MNFKEYISQSDSKKMPVFSVDITKENAFQIIKDMLSVIIVLKISNQWFSYLIDKEGNMFTIDDDGNCDKASCFKFIDKI